MMTASKCTFCRAALTAAVMVTVIAVAMVAITAVTLAAGVVEPTFPAGSRVGLVPPDGMTPSKTFAGFEDRDKKAAILLSTLPGAAYGDMEKSLADDLLEKQGITVERREPMQIGAGKGILVVGTQTNAEKISIRKWMMIATVGGLTAVVIVQVPEHDSTYSDATVRAALATLTLRASVPDSEKLSLLPFTIGDLAGFHIKDVIPGRALMLVDTPEYPHMIVSKGLPEYDLDARFFVAAMPGGPSGDDDRGNFARFAFNTIGGIKDIHLTMSEPVRIDNQEAFETVAQAKDADAGNNVMVVQWLRFESGGFLQMVGIARTSVWPAELPRLRAIRDSTAFR